MGRGPFGKLCTILLLHLPLVGCGDGAVSGESCTDPATIGLIGQTVRKSVERQAAQLEADRSSMGYPFNAFSPVSRRGIDKSASLVPLAVTSIAVVRYDKPVDRYTCRGTLTANVPDLTLVPGELRDGGIDFGISVEMLGTAATKVGLPFKTAMNGERQVGGRAVEVPIEFSTQIMVDTKQRGVALYGEEDVTALLLAIAKSEVYLKGASQSKPVQPGPRG